MFTGGRHHTPLPNCCFNKRPVVCRVPLINWSNRTECCSCQSVKKNNVCFFSSEERAQKYDIGATDCLTPGGSVGGVFSFTIRWAPLFAALDLQAGLQSSCRACSAPVVTSRLLHQMCKWIHRDCFDPLISPLISSACWMSPLSLCVTGVAGSFPALHSL